MIEIVAFDADDTLWHNEIYYRRAKQDFIRHLSRYSEDAGWLERRLDEIEEGNVEIYGYGIKSFTLSMIEAAIELSQGSVTAGELDGLMDLGRRMLDTRVQIFPHTKDVLQQLAQQWRMLLITKGDVFEQSQKIERTGLKGYFQHIEIVGVKTSAVYKAIFERYGIDPRHSIMIGNSLRSDILPILELGGSAVYIPYAHTWAHEHVELGDTQPDGYYELEHLGQLPGLLRDLSSAEE